MILSKNKWNIQYTNNYSDNEIISILHEIKGISDYISYHNLGFKDFNDPFLFKNMDIVIKKIKMSIRNNEKILIYGDYDVDGITAISILYKILKHKGANVFYRVPNRFFDGYGLGNDVVDEIISDGYNLVITVDNGITAIEETEKLTKAGISVIITDHHEPKETLPNTEYIIHSYLMHDYPYEGMCGAGVAFKIAEALDKDYIRDYVDLVMLGTIADMMPQTGENKAFINEGLKKINNSSCLGLRMLLDELKIHVNNIKDISFKIAPKLNSLGRIGDASVAVDLLIESDPNKIKEDIKALVDADALRKELTAQNTELAYKMIDPNDKVILIYSPSFYEGVLGIIAQKVMKKTGKITGVFNVNQENYARGSFRTVGDCNILELLEKNADILDKFGGHEKACGVSMKASHIKELKDRLSIELSEIIPREPTLDIACKLNHTLLNIPFANELEQYDLLETDFLFKDLEVVQTAFLADKHTKVKAKLSNGNYINVMCFNDPSLSFNLQPGDLIDVVGEINKNNYNGFEHIQIIAKDYKVSGVQVIDYRARSDFDNAIQYFDKDNGLVIKDNFESISDLDLLIREQDPNIVYIAPIAESKLDSYKIVDPSILKRTIYLISLNPNANEIVLQKELRVSKDVLNNVLTIFEELSLIKRDNGSVKSIPKEKGERIHLEDSKTFMMHKESNEVTSFLRSDIKDIKNYILERLE